MTTMRALHHGLLTATARAGEQQERATAAPASMLRRPVSSFAATRFSVLPRRQVRGTLPGNLTPPGLLGLSMDRGGRVSMRQVGGGEGDVSHPARWPGW